MPKLPTRDDLGGLPSARSGRPLARVDTTAVGEGVSALGKAAVDLGAKLGKASEDEEERIAAYEAEKRIVQFTRDQTRRLDDEQRSMAPGGAGFTDGFAGSYDTAARELFGNAQREGLSDRALRRLDIGLLRGGEALQTRANAYENAERNRLGEFELQEVLATVRGNVRADPNLLSNERERGRILIEGAPNIDARNRHTILRGFNRLVEEEALQAMRERVRTPEDLRRFNEWAAAHARTPGGVTRRGPTPDAFQPGVRPGGGAPRDGAAPPAGAPDAGGVRTLGGEPPAAARPGSVSARYESGGRGVGFISSGRSDPGGPSYGVHQLSGVSSMPAFLRSPEGEPYRQEFGNARPMTPEFDRIYGRVAARDPEGFANAQYTFYERTHYQPARQVAQRVGFDVSNRGIQEALFSIGVQHGGAVTIIERAGSRLPPNASIESQVRALYDARAGYVEGLSSLPEETRRSVLDRYRSEVNDVLALARQPAAAAPRALGGPRPPGSSPAEPDLSYDAQLGVDLRRPLPGPMRAGSPEWLENVLDEEERAPGTLSRTTLPNVTSTRLRSEARGAAAQVRQTRTEILNAIKGWERGAMDGLSPSAAEVAQAREAVEAFNDGSEEGLQVAEYFHSIVGYPDGRQGLIGRVGALRQLHPVELSREIAAERQRQRAAGTTEADRRLLTHMETLLTRAREQINTDPNGWAAAVGRSPAPEQLNFDDDASMQARADLARRNGQMLGQAPRFFDPDEREWVRDRVEVLGQSTERNVTYGGVYLQTPNLGGWGWNTANPILVPSNMRQDGVPYALDALTIEDLRTGTDYEGVGRIGPLDGSGREMTMADLRAARLVSVGPGRYAFAEGDPASGGPARWVRDASGERFILDLAALEPTLRQRAPEIYRGYVEPAAAAFRPQGFPGPANVPGRLGGEAVTLGPDHPDYPKGDFAPRVNPGRAITRDEWIEFQRQFSANRTRAARQRIMSTRSLYQEELRSFIDSLPPQQEARQ